MTTGYAMGPYLGKESGDTTPLRQLFEQFSVGDTLLGDGYYCGWFILVLLLQRGVDVVTRQHQLRTTDFRRGRRLGKSDHLVVWPKPARFDWMDKEIYDSLPDSLTVRELEVCVEQPGFRVDSFVVVTTLTKATRYKSHTV